MRWWDPCVRGLMAGGLLALLLAGCTGEDKTIKPPDPIVTPPGIGYPGMDARVNALAVHDGTGRPSLEGLYAGGSFRTAGGDTALGIARWDGSQWHEMNGGVVGRAATVHAIAAIDTAILVGGSFSGAGTTGADHFVRWNGEDWFRISTGTGDVVYAMAVWNDQVVIGGSFSTPHLRIAAYDGSVLNALGSGFSGGDVFALTVHEGDLIAGGSFTRAGAVTTRRIARWDGTTWSPLRDGFDGDVLALASYDGMLYAGGTFSEATGPWHTEPVDTESDVGQYASHVLDAAGTSHVAYYDATDGALVYAHQFGGGWERYVVDDSLDVGQYASLALDADQKPHFAYFDASSGKLRYATLDSSGTGWDIDVVPDAGIYGEHCSLDIDSEGFPWISFYSQQTGSLRYARLDVTGLWIVNPVDPAIGTGISSSLKIDRGDVVHVAYYDQTTRDPKYARRAPDDTRWTLETVDGFSERGRYVSLALDPNGVPHISYTGLLGVSERLFHKVRLGGSPPWPAAALAVDQSAPSVGKYASLAFGPGGLPRIAYWDETNDRLKLAVATGPGTIAGSYTWDVDVPDPGPGSGRFASLVVTASDAFRIVHYKPAGGDLVVSERVPGTPLRRIARWEGTDWTPVGTGIDWWTRCLMVDGGELLVAGAFQEAGGFTADRLASWNGGSWAPVPTGIDRGEIWSLVDFNGHLIAAGNFTHRGAYRANFITDLGQ